MKSKLLVILAWIIVFTNACQGTAPGTPTAQVLPSPSVSPLPTETVTPSLTPTATATPTITPTITPTSTPIIVGPSAFPDNVNPLTGLVVSDPTLLDRRPVMIKVANFPSEGRPHSGLSFADIVFDYYIGEGANRFLAIYYGQNAIKVGPIRSGRLVDAQLVPMYHGILAHMGADVNYVLPTLLDALGYRLFIGGPNSCPALCDDGTHKVTSWFSDTAAMTEWAVRREVESHERFNLEGMAFDSRPSDWGEAADQVAVNYFTRNRAEWHYDPASGKYLRWIEARDEERNVILDADGNLTMIPLIDRLTNAQLAFDNVVVIVARYTEYSDTLHDINIVGEGSGGAMYLFRDGKEYEGRWRPWGRYNPMRFLTSDGAPMPFKPGNSWIFILGQNSLVTQPEPGKWEVNFYLP